MYHRRVEFFNKEMPLIGLIIFIEFSYQYWPKYWESLEDSHCSKLGTNQFFFALQITCRNIGYII